MVERMKLIPHEGIEGSEREEHLQFTVIGVPGKRKKINDDRSRGGWTARLDKEGRIGRRRARSGCLEMTIVRNIDPA